LRILLAEPAVSRLMTNGDVDDPESLLREAEERALDLLESEQER
jgi:hypothetical protein